MSGLMILFIESSEHNVTNQSYRISEAYLE